MSESTLSPPKSATRKVELATQRFFALAETIIYVLVGLAFLAGSVGMLGYSIVNFIQTYEALGIPSAVLTLINDLLLVMIIMEVLRTIVSYLEEQGTSLKPFLFIAAISATRRVLAIGAQMSISSQASSASETLSSGKFNEAMIDLGMNAVAILIIALALYLLDRNRTIDSVNAPARGADSSSGPHREPVIEAEN